MLKSHVAGGWKSQQTVPSQNIAHVQQFNGSGPNKESKHENANADIQTNKFKHEHSNITNRRQQSKHANSNANIQTQKSKCEIRTRSPNTNICTQNEHVLVIASHSGKQVCSPACAAAWRASMAISSSIEGHHFWQLQLLAFTGATSRAGNK